MVCPPALRSVLTRGRCRQGVVLLGDMGEASEQLSGGRGCGDLVARGDWIEALGAQIATQVVDVASAVEPSAALRLRLVRAP